MSSTQRAAELRALADDYDGLGALEDASTQATEAFRADPSPENKEAHHDAAQALVAHRQRIRSAPVQAAESGGMTIVPSTVGTAA